MPFVEADNIYKFLNEPTTTSDDLLNILNQVAHALCYIHDSGFVHLDVKPENILVYLSANRYPNALLSDFGFCKQVSIDKEGLTLVMGTDGYIDPDLLAMMSEKSSSNPDRIRDMVKRSGLRTQFDRYAFSATILDTLLNYLELQSSAVQRTIPSQVLRGLQIISLRCAGRNASFMANHHKFPKRQYIGTQPLFTKEIGEILCYKNTLELIENLAVLQKGLNAVPLEPEITETSSEIICIPPRSQVPISTRVISTIDSVLIRRLSTVAQLALCYHVYPGASHTRKEHTLGAYYITVRFLRQLLLDQKNPLCSLLLNRKYQRLVLLAALLHDFAHVPLMHELEDSLPELTQNRFASEILSGLWGDQKYRNELYKIIKIWELQPEDLQIILGEKDLCVCPTEIDSATGNKRISKEQWDKLWELPEYELIKSIIDSAVDADKVDYLQRDALHAGVQFGYGIDLARLERQITGTLKLEGDQKGKWCIKCSMGVWEKGQTAAEAVIGVRHSMYSQVYAHKTVRSARAMLNYIVWKWRKSPSYANFSPTKVANRYFMKATGLIPVEISPDFPGFFDIPEPQILNISPQPEDNLPYAEALLIRWMAHVSQDKTAILMSNDLIQRRLYKCIFELKEDEIDSFLDLSYPKKTTRRIRLGTEWGPEEWLGLFTFLGYNVMLFLKSFESNVFGEWDETIQIPPLLVDVALPKTMRYQKELTIQTEILNYKEVSLQMLERLSKTQNNCLLGLNINHSDIYEVYGGRSGGEGLSPLVIRVFARPDLSDRLRQRLEKTAVINWLNSYSPP
jgi:HD superfamily phosphohydrolase